MDEDTGSTVTCGASAHDDQPVLEAVGLHCRYGTFEAVAGIDLQVGRGELFALLGTNGAGKTTTLETLEGHRTADEGRVRVLGQDPGRNRRRIAARVGVVLQDSGLPAQLTAVETLRLWARLHGAAADDRALDEPLRRVGLEHRRDVVTQQLSGGERRRLDLALALSTSPELLFLDEPTTGMDPEARRRTWEVIRSLRAQGTTILLTTHYLEEAEALADRIAIMHRGRIAVEGTLADVVATQPAHIGFQLPGDAVGPTLPELSGEVHVSRHAACLQVTVTTRTLQADLTRLLDWARHYRLRLDRITASEASLASIFHQVSKTHPAEVD